MHCYSELAFQCHRPALRHVQHTFLITVAGSRRADEAVAALRRTRPTKYVTVIYNQTFRTCKKRHVDNPGQDLWDANLRAFEKAARSARPVLVLEDDAVFGDAFRAFAPEIDRFLATSSCQVYNLGCVPLLADASAPPPHLRVFAFFYAHAVIYSASARAALLRTRVRRFHDLEIAARRLAMYAPAFPLAFQRIVPTDNTRSPTLALTDLLGGRNHPTLFFERFHQLAPHGGVAAQLLLLCAALATALAAQHANFHTP